MIDAHHHVWTLGQHGQEWPTPDLGTIHRDIAPDEIQALGRPLGVTGSILVQSQPNAADTDFLLDLAARRPFVRGVVGWLDMQDPAAPERLQVLVDRGGLCGLRPMLQSEADDDWILIADIDRAVQAMIGHGLVFDALVLSRHLPFLRCFAERWPTLSIVIDHGAKPPLGSDRGSDMSLWSGEIRRLAACPNVSCKLSGLWTEAPGSPLSLADAAADLLFDAFGAGRLIWGSDWPVLNLVGDYADWLNYCRQRTPAEHRAAVFHDNAVRTYGLDRRPSLTSRPMPNMS